MSVCLTTRKWWALAFLAAAFASHRHAPGASGWHPTFDAAKIVAKQSGKDVLVYFYTPGAAICIEARARVFTADYVAQLARSYELTQIDLSGNSEEAEKIAPEIVKAPAVKIFHATGEPKETLTRFADAVDFKRQLDRLVLGKSEAKGPSQTPAPLTSQTIDSLVDQANDLVKAGQWQEGEKLLRQVLERDPRHRRALNNLGFIEARFKNDYEKAEQYFRQVLKYYPDDGPAQTNLKKVMDEYRKQGKTVSAPAPTPEESADIPKLLDGARSLLTQGKTAEAEAIYQLILKKDSTNIKALNNLGAIEGQRGNYAKAISYWERVLAIDPAERDAADNISIARMKMKK